MLIGDVWSAWRRSTFCGGFRRRSGRLRTVGGCTVPASCRQRLSSGGCDIEGRVQTRFSTEARALPRYFTARESCEWRRLEQKNAVECGTHRPSHSPRIRCLQAQAARDLTFSSMWPEALAEYCLSRSNVVSVQPKSLSRRLVNVCKVCRAYSGADTFSSCRCFFQYWRNCLQRSYALLTYPHRVTLRLE